jgi:hypothetical protein
VSSVQSNNIISLWKWHTLDPLLACYSIFVIVVKSLHLICTVLYCIDFHPFFVTCNIWTNHSIMQVNKHNYNIYKHATIWYNHKQYISATLQYTQTTIYNTYTVMKSKHKCLHIYLFISFHVHWSLYMTQDRSYTHIAICEKCLSTAVTLSSWECCLL